MFNYCYLLFSPHPELINFDQQTCVVRPHIHFLEQPPQHENAFIWPHAVQISQCAGSCNVRQDIMTCRPANKILIPLRAYWVPYHSSRKRRDVMDEIANLKGMLSHILKFTIENIGYPILSHNTHI